MIYTLFFQFGLGKYRLDMLVYRDTCYHRHRTASMRNGIFRNKTKTAIFPIVFNLSVRVQRFVLETWWSCLALCVIRSKRMEDMAVLNPIYGTTTGSNKLLKGKKKMKTMTMMH